MPPLWSAAAMPPLWNAAAVPPLWSAAACRGFPKTGELLPLNSRGRGRRRVRVRSVAATASVIHQQGRVMARGNAAVAALCAAVLAAVSAANLQATTRYVWPNSPFPLFPYISWMFAAHTIQDAVDAAGEGDTILVTNGVYATGAKMVPGAVLQNRVAVTKPMTIQSVNGPDQTIIVGAPDATTNGYGPNATRCLYASNGVTIVGFTLSNGYTDVMVGVPPFAQIAGGGAFLLDNVVLSNCTIVRCKGFYSAGAVADYMSMVTRCSFVGNNPSNDGSVVSVWRDSVVSDCGVVGGNIAAASGSCVLNCRQEGNVGYAGIVAIEASSVLNSIAAANTGGFFGAGGIMAISSLVSNCVVKDSVGVVQGALYAEGSMIQNCSVVSNKGSVGLYVVGSTVNACKVAYNEGTSMGAGAYAENSLLANSLIARNITYHGTGGGVYAGPGVTILNCTIVLNTCLVAGAGLYSNYGTVVRNSVLDYNLTNTVQSVVGTNVIEYCVTHEPGVGNNSNYAQFVDYAHDDFHVLSTSPCIDSGTNGCVYSDYDLDGNWRIEPAGGTVDIGAYEVVPEPVIVWSALALLFGVRRK
ncbi:hypothetical protein GX586_03340 [bacterium]|nr:hypothetical protein [bacterium]